ncbi:MAG: CHAT domain-containing protein, partial [Phycisphaerae bacterium]
VNRRASEASVRQALVRGDVVHVATHGILNVRNPMFSRIELARESKNGSSDDDGRLEVHELLELSIASPLVFLSGCETGVGAAGWTQFAKGEDYATLAQAFLYAGADNVVATLWRIDDEGAARFAEHFYRRLGSRNATTALAEAQREMMQDPDYGAPYYWAAYRLTGSGALP